jgi:putative colanic acid biosynthesis glycosyltransferase
MISIVTISRNSYQGLSDTLASVNRQDYQNIEHIIIDGDSTDGSKELLDSYQHSKKYYYSSEPDRGISSAFNKGLDKSTGNLIFFLNAGDLFYSDTVVSEVVQSYLTHNWRCAIGKLSTTNLTGETTLYQPPKLSSHFLKYFMFLPHQAFFCERSLHEGFYYDESIKTSMDYELFIRMLNNIEIFYLDIITASMESGGVSSNTDKRVAEQSQIRLRYAANFQDKAIINLVNWLILLKSRLKIDSPFRAKKV